jgi:hypothetical protein
MKNNLTGSHYDYWYSSLMDGKLEDVYLDYQLDESQVKEKLASGDIIDDRRLANLLAGD